MRRLGGVLGLAILLLAGCNGTSKLSGIFRPNQAVAVNPQAPPPTAAGLVDYLNRNSRQIQSMEVMDLDLDAKQGLTPVGLTGKLVCARPRYFRLGANLVGSRAADIGSNDQEFWFWISKADPPYLFHCTYADYGAGKARMPFPFQPEWIMEALGMGEYGAPENYQLVPRGNSLLLVQHTTSPQGQPLQKIIFFNNDHRAPVRVTEFRVQDAKGQIVCSAHVGEVQNVNGVLVPKRVTLSWPAEKLELKMHLGDVRLNQPLDQARMTALFQRPSWPGVTSYDLARGRDLPTNSIRPAGGYAR